MIDAIYASKLYKASKRKDIIAAAFNDQRNAGLVTQLASYLDEQYQDLAKAPEPVPEQSDADANVADDIGEGGTPKEGGSAPSSHGHAGGGGHFSMPSSLDAGLDEDFSPEDNLVTVDDEEIPEVSDVPESEPEEPVEESENVYGCTDVTDRVEVIKGTLNGQAETAGVARIHVKDNEMWIYYKDEVNLNNIMTNVIEYMNAAGYTDLEFNRLARSDNAIVFVINSVQEDIKPIETVEAAGRVRPVAPTSSVGTDKKDSTRRNSQQPAIVRAIGLVKSLISPEDSCTNSITDVTKKDDTHITVTFKNDSVDYDITDVDYLNKIRKHRGENAN